MIDHALTLVLTLIGVAAAAAPPAGKEDRPADRAAIRRHIDQIFQAYMNRDRAGVRATHGAGWRGFLRPSQTIVRGIDQYMREAETILGSAGRLRSYEMVDLDVQFHGDMALVPYIARIVWEEDGVGHPDTLRVIDVYAKQDGHWNQVGSQVATHPDALAASRQQPRTLSPSERAQLLDAREGVWRAWFAGDVKRLEAALPEDFLSINSSNEPWKGRRETVADAVAFRATGTRLVGLEFPLTEVRAYGDVAVIYTTYEAELEAPSGERKILAGRGTEIFVLRNGQWVHPGWHLDSVH